jgi:hypothetical protein
MPTCVYQVLLTLLYSCLLYVHWLYFVTNLHRNKFQTKRRRFHNVLSFRKPNHRCLIHKYLNTHSWMQRHLIACIIGINKSIGLARQGLWVLIVLALYELKNFFTTRLQHIPQNWFFRIKIEIDTLSSTKVKIMYMLSQCSQKPTADCWESVYTNAGPEFGLARQGLWVLIV